MGNNNEKLKLLLKRCQGSCMFFIENFCKVKHPKAGVIPFKLFKYQKKSINHFIKHKFNCYRKVRQSGVSTLAGAFALWYAMFFSNKRVLIVSKRDEDAKEFLKKNVKFVYDNLPKFYKEIFGFPEPPIYNEHSVGFNNGSIVKSLTSSPTTMRSESASLNIIDEAAFMPHMEEMWSGAAATMIHGGGCIVISTSNGQGGWYHNTWEEAELGRNDFNPIYIPWWDMDWTIKYRDEFTGKQLSITPTQGIRECTTKEEQNKYGPYWSPWLEEQYRMLQAKGEAHLFKQEILAEFLGTGNTVLAAETLKHISTTISPKYWVVSKVDYIHPVTDLSVKLDFENELRIWQKPVKPEPDLVENGRIIKPGLAGHTYSIGMDISSGEADDCSALVVVDCDTKEQVADLNIKVLPATLLMMVDYLARWYNGAYIVPERTGLGIPVCQSLYNDMGYSNVYRMKTPAGKMSRKIGFPTSPTHKPQLNKNLLDYLGEDGVIVYSQRIFDQLCIYIHLGNNRTGNVKGPGNHDDLSIGLGLALFGIKEAVQADQRSLIPAHNVPLQPAETTPEAVRHNTEKIKNILAHGGLNALVPIVPGSTAFSGMPDVNEEILKFTQQLGGTPYDPKYGNPIFHRGKPTLIPKRQR